MLLAGRSSMKRSGKAAIRYCVDCGSRIETGALWADNGGSLCPRCGGDRYRKRITHPRRLLISLITNALLARPGLFRLLFLSRRQTTCEPVSSVKTGPG